MSSHTSLSQYFREVVAEQHDSPLPLDAQTAGYSNVIVGGERRVRRSPHQHRIQALGNSPAFSIPQRQYPAHSQSATMPLQKRSAPDDSNGTPAKQIKTEHPEEFSKAVKKRLQSSSRTGQACDRCKVSATAAPHHQRLNQKANCFSRFAKSDAMDSQEAVPHVCRTIQSVGRPIGLLVGPHRVAMSKG